MYYDSPGLGARLIRLPGQLLLALVNATALLVIIACILTIVTLNRVDDASARIAGSVTDAALSRLQMSPVEFKTRLTELDDRIELLSGQLANPDNLDHWEVTQQLRELNQNLAELKTTAKGITAAGPEVTSAAFEEAGDALTRALHALRGCAPETATVAPEG